MSERPVPSLLADIIASADRIVSIQKQAASLRGPPHENNDLAAILYNFVVIGEAASRLPREFRDAHAQIPWHRVIGHRNVVAHGYDIIDSNLIVETIEHHLPPLIDECRRLLQEFGPPPRRR